MKYFGIDASKIKAKYKKFIDLTIFKEGDDSQQVVLSTEQYGTDVELKITDGSTGDVVIECGTLP